MAKSYGGTNTPGVIYCYDGKVPAADGSGCAAAGTTVLYSNGRLTGVGSSAGMTRYTGLDSMGRVSKYEQWVDGTAYPFVYGYLLGGQQSMVRYPSGREWSSEYSAAARPVSLANGGTAGACAAPGCYASGVTYASHGGMVGGTFGPLVQRWSYNSRLQGTGLAVTMGGAALWSMTNSFSATSNNGNISGQTVTASGAGGVNVTSTLAYDALNRLTGVTEGGMSQTFGYDSVGNRWVSGGMNLSPFTPTTSAWFEAGTNRFASGVTYDDAASTGPGNMTGLGNVTLEYDAENRQKAATVGGVRTEYWYDGDGRRVKKRTGAGAAPVYVYEVGG